VTYRVCNHEIRNSDQTSARRTLACYEPLGATFLLILAGDAAAFNIAPAAVPPGRRNSGRGTRRSPPQASMTSRLEWAESADSSRSAELMVSVCRRHPIRTLNTGSFRAKSSHYSAGIPALRRLAKLVSSNSARMSGTPKPCCTDGFQTGRARISIVATQPPGFGEFSGGPVCIALEGVRRREVGVNLRPSRICDAHLLVPEDCLVYAALQQMRHSNR
jgi:hypothetical protein